MQIYAGITYYLNVDITHTECRYYILSKCRYYPHRTCPPARTTWSAIICTNHIYILISFSISIYCIITIMHTNNIYLHLSTYNRTSQPVTLIIYKVISISIFEYILHYTIKLIICTVMFISISMHISMHILHDTDNTY